MGKKKIKISKNIERVLLTEVLPYEVPLIFSNRYFYSFCLQNNIEDLKIKYAEIFKFLSQQKYTIPLTFSISREGQNPRELSIIHPAKQIEIVNFYKKYKDTMLYYANQSPFSIRKPVKIGQYYYSNIDEELSEKEGKPDIEDSLEIMQQEGEHFKSFFSYYRYGNVHKFYESRQYQDCEKRFSNLYRFDINKCFDSIYTHSIAWAIYSKDFVKKNLSMVDESFAGQIDKLMQSLNYNETNGILIGSEFARIFAEIILQKIDKNVYQTLEKNNIFSSIDYKIFRYVDDHFLFYNDEKVKDSILELYASNLKKFKMSINQSKIYQYSHPIITELSIAKKKIRDYIFEQVFLDKTDSVKMINANRMIVDIKIFIKESGAEYRGVTNYLLALLLSAIQRNKTSFFQDKIRNIFEMLDFIFFIFSVDISVSSINRTIHLIKELLEISKNFTFNERSRIVDKIFFEFERLIKKSLSNSSLQSKEMYLLVLLREEEIYQYRQIGVDLFERFIQLNQNLGYFDIVILLFYMQNDDRYLSPKKLLWNKIKEKCKKLHQCFAGDIYKHTEASLLFFDLMSCPFIKSEEVMEIYNIQKQDRSKYLELSKKQKYWFIKWGEVNLSEEIQYRKASETYS